MQNPKIGSIINVAEKKYDKEKNYFKFIFVKNIFFLLVLSV
tara:strand:- start:598 stop:720 length:123 start_codon:yes stop_codon:yes gene_type:complete